MDYKLSDAELEVMQILWANGELRASAVADLAKAKTGWEKNTAYTFLQRLVKKGAVSRRDPGFYCTAACSREDVQGREARGMVDKLFDGSIGMFVHAFANGSGITPDEREALQTLIDQQK